MAKVLKMNFTLDNGKTFTYNLAEPKSDLTKSAVDAVMQQILDKKAVALEDKALKAIQGAFIRTTEDTPLV